MLAVLHSPSKLSLTLGVATSSSPACTVTVTLAALIADTSGALPAVAVTLIGMASWWKQANLATRSLSPLALGMSQACSSKTLSAWMAWLVGTSHSVLSHL